MHKRWDADKALASTCLFTLPFAIIHRHLASCLNSHYAEYVDTFYRPVRGLLNPPVQEPYLPPWSPGGFA